MFFTEGMFTIGFVMIGILLIRGGHLIIGGVLAAIGLALLVANTIYTMRRDR